MLRQEQRVGSPRPQRRQVELNDVDAVVQVLAEAAFIDGRFQVAVRGGEDADVDGDFLLAADRPDLALLQGPQQLGLRGQRHLADFVEKQRPALGQREKSLAVAAGVGEGPLHVPEQLALQQRIGQRRDVHRDERLFPPLAMLVQAPGNHLLARAAFAHDQHRGLGIGDLRQLVVQLEHGRALAQDVLEAARSLQRLAERMDLLLELPPFDRAAEDDGQQLHFDRLGDEVVGPRANGGNGRLQVAEGRHDDDRHVRPVGRQPAQNSSPSMPGIFRSVSTASKSSRQEASKASAAEVKQRGAKSRSRRSVSNKSHMLRSSSTIRIRGFTASLPAAERR